MRLSIYSWHAFDALLRGKLDFSERVRLLSVWAGWQVLCAAVFGLSLGVYGLTSRPDPDLRYMLASFIKMPLLLLLTSLVTCPSLYVFGALRQLRFSAIEFGAMLMVAHTILAAVLGSLAPIVTFFALTTRSYSFMVMLNVLACTLAGLLGIRVFIRTINEPDSQAPAAEAPAEHESGPAPVFAGRFARPSNISNSIWQLLGWWIVLYVFVAGQMGWILRPFIGSPDLPFVFLRGKAGSLFEGVVYHIRMLAGL